MPAEAYEQAKVYCIVIFAGGVGSLGYNVNTGIMQGREAIKKTTGNPVPTAVRAEEPT